MEQNITSGNEIARITATELLDNSDIVYKLNNGTTELMKPNECLYNQLMTYHTHQDTYKLYATIGETGRVVKLEMKRKIFSKTSKPKLIMYSVAIIVLIILVISILNILLY